MLAQHHIGVISITALLALGFVGLAWGCFRPSSPSTPTRAPAPTADWELVEVRNLGLGYWNTFNSYDLEALLAYLEPSYREERKEVLLSEVRLLKLFRVKLGVSVTSEPELTGPKDAQMYVTLREPTGSRRVLMRFQKDPPQAGWMITYAQEVKEGQ